MRYVLQNGVLVPRTSLKRQRGFITCGPAFFGGSSGAPPTGQSVWSTTNKAPDIVLSDGNTTAGSVETPETGGMVLSDSGKTSGKFYVEVVKTGGSTYQASQFGLHAGTSALNMQVGDDANGWSTIVYGAAGANRASYHSGTLSNTSSLAFVSGQTGCMAVDLDAGNVWFTRFGASGWMGGGDPASGTSPTFTFTPSGTYYFAACPRSSSNYITITAPGSWLYSAPTGFGVWTP